MAASSPAVSSAPAPSSLVARRQCCHARLPRRHPLSPLAQQQMDLKNEKEKGREVKQKSKKGNSEEEEPKGSFQAKRVTCAGICSRGLHHRRIAGAVPCRRTAPCRRILPCRRTLPCRGTLPWRCSRSRWHFGSGFRALLVGLLCSCINQQSDISKERSPMRA